MRRRQKIIEDPHPLGQLSFLSKLCISFIPNVVRTFNFMMSLDFHLFIFIASQFALYSVHAANIYFPVECCEGSQLSVAWNQRDLHPTTLSSLVISAKGSACLKKPRGWPKYEDQEWWWSSRIRQQINHTATKQSSGWLHLLRLLGALLS